MIFKLGEKRPSREERQATEKARLQRAQAVAEQTGQRWERVKTWVDSPFFSGK